MRIQFVYCILPTPVFFVDSLGEWKAGEVRGPVVRIRKDCAEDAGLLAHELTHVKQWWRTAGLHSVLYLLSKSYRLKSEVEAYKAQAACYPDDRTPLFAYYLSTRYGLDITHASAILLMRGQ